MQANVGGTYDQIITIRLYIQEGMIVVNIQEGRDMISQRYEDSTFERQNISLVRTNFIIAKTVLIRGTKTKVLSIERNNLISIEKCY